MKTKYRIAFILSSMEVGGVAKMLLYNLKKVNSNKYDVYILLFEEKGELLKALPKWVNIKIIKGNKYAKIRTYMTEILSNHRIVFNFIKNIYHRFGILFISKNINKTEGKYDIAIAFQDGMATWYTANNINAYHKFAVVHTDFKQAKYNVNNEINIYMTFNKIYCTSYSARQSFISCMPIFDKCTEVLLPYTDKLAINKLVDTKILKQKNDCMRIVTVARLSHEKGVDKAIKALAKLIKNGYAVEWYFIGDGPDRKRLVKMVKKMQCKENAVFLGNIENPYSIMASCDIYVQPSNYESYCMTLAEARALGCAIVTSNFPSACEQLQKNTGLIAGNTWESLYEGIKKMLDEPQLRKKFSDQCKMSFEQKTSSCDIMINDLDKFIKI